MTLNILPGTRAVSNRYAHRLQQGVWYRHIRPGRNSFLHVLWKAAVDGQVNGKGFPIAFPIVTKHTRVYISNKLELAMKIKNIELTFPEEEGVNIDPHLKVRLRWTFRLDT